MTTARRRPDDFSLAAVLAALSAVLVLVGLRRGTPSERAPVMPLARILREGLGAARRNPRIWMACLLQFGSFGDRVVLGTFLMLRLQHAWLERGLPMHEATSRARGPFIAAMAAGLVTALVVGVLLDRVDRLRIGVAAMALAALAYLACGFIDADAGGTHARGRGDLLGVGQIAAIIVGPDAARAGGAARPARRGVRTGGRRSLRPPSCSPMPSAAGCTTR